MSEDNLALRMELEELRRENQELRHKMQQLASRHDEIVHLLSRSNMAAVFLNYSLQVERFTPQASQVFELEDTDMGRPLSDVSTSLVDVDLLADCRQAQQEMEVLEREVESLEGKVYLMRILPGLGATVSSGQGLVLTLLDITPRKQREQELQLAYERLNQAQQVSLSGNFDRNLQTGEGFWSDQVFRLFGYEPGEVHQFQERFFHHVHGDDLQRVKDALHQAVHCQRLYDVRFRYYTRQGELRWGYSQGRVQLDEEGTPLRLYGIFQDITQQRSYEHRLQVERERLAMALEATGAGVYEIAIPMQGDVYRSQKWFDIHGVDGGELPRDNEHFYKWYASRIEPEGVAAMRQVLQEYEQGIRHAHRETYRYQKPSGEWIWIETVGRRVEYEQDGSRLVGAAMDVTSRMQTQEELRQHRDHLQELVRQGNRELARSEALHRTVIKHYPNGSVVVFDHELRYQLAGGEALETVGLTPDDLLGKTVRQVFEDDFGAEVENMFRRCLKGEHVVAEMYYKDEIYEVQALPVRDEHDDIVLGMAKSQRVTEKRTLERARHEQEQLYRNLVRNAPDIIARFDGQGRIVFVNDAIERYTRRPMKRFLGSGLEVLDLEDSERGKFANALQQALAQGEETTTQVTATLEGQRYSFHIRLAPERDVDGTVAGLLCIARDLTGLFSLQQERERLLELIEATPDLVFTLDPDGCLQYCNKGACDILGLELKQQPKNLNCDLVYPEQELEQLQQVFMPRAREQGFWSGESRLLCREGRLLPVKQTVVSQTADQEQGQLYSVIAHDLSELKKRERDLHEAKDRAEAASRSKSEFLANMSHELRTPIAGILGMAGLLLRDPATYVVREKVEMIQQAGDSLLNIINDVLDLSKIEARGLELEEQDFPLQRLANHLQGMFEHQAREKGLAFSLRLDEALPRQIHGDEQRIAQVLRNLVSNAIKFTENGSVSVYIQLLEQRSTSLRLALNVTDSGIGIPEEEQHRLFTSFTQLDSSYAKEHGGTGLGLAICKELVEFMHGSLELQSASGEGSRFTVILPLKQAQQQVVEARETTSDQSGKDVAHKPDLRVLAVDDNTINRLYIGELLEELGLTPRLASSGNEALQALADEAFDCVLMDVQMPGMDGMETTRRIRESGATWKDVPVIALTAYAMKGDKGRFLDAGMNEYLAKPVEGEDLLQAIRNVMQTSAPQAPSVAGEMHRATTAAEPEQQVKSAGMETDAEPDTATDTGTSPASESVKSPVPGPVPDNLQAMVLKEQQRLFSRLKKLRQGRMLCQEFLADIPTKRQAIQQALEAEDMESLTHEAHSLGGAAGVLGLQGLLAQVRVVDSREIHEMETPRRRQEVEHLLQCLEAARQAVEAEFANARDD